jgi:hypothetical protein
MKAKMVMPAIYRFEIPDHPKESRWGWHSIPELKKSITNIINSDDFVEIGKKFSNLNPGNFLSIHNNRLYQSSIGTGDKWLVSVFRDGEGFMPAMIGIKIINAIKHPIRNSIKTFLKEAVE